jgi:hypothetical protein
VIITDAHSAIAQEQIQRIPLPQRVRNRYSQRSIRRSLAPEAVQLPTQLLNARNSACASLPSVSSSRSQRSANDSTKFRRLSTTCTACPFSTS